MLFQRRDKQSVYKKMQETVLPSKGWKRPFYYIALRLKRRPGTPEFIAKGFAIGMLISFTPFIGIHFVGAIALAWLLRADTIAAAFASLIINAPVTFGVIFPLSYRVGKAILDLQPRLHNTQLDSFQELLHQIWPITSVEHFLKIFWELFMPMTLGGVVMGIPVSLVCYHMVRKAVIIFQKQREAILHRRLKRHFNHLEADIEKNNPRAE